MDLLTTGAFARASGLTRKALRLYDDLGLLRPAVVDESTGYRYYHRDQLALAALVAWLRRAGMPLARIRPVCDLAPAHADAAIRAWWAETERDVRARRALVHDLLSTFHAQEDDMATSTPPLTFEAAAATDRGLVRPDDLDRASAGPDHLAVSDGFGPSGAQVSAALVAAIADLGGDLEPGEALERLHGLVATAAQKIEDPDAGATVTALVRCGAGRLALVHVGDSRAYLLRDGRLTRLTHDHTLVRSMVEAGELTEAEAASHPRRSVLLRAVGPGDDVEPDLGQHMVCAGDRLLLATDGLHGVVAAEAIAGVLRDAPTPTRAVAQLLDLAVAAGAPDNIAVGVADVTEQRRDRGRGRRC